MLGAVQCRFRCHQRNLPYLPPAPGITARTDLLVAHSRVLIIGDTHGDSNALRASFDIAAANHCNLVISVGDVWWRPRAASHENVAAALDRGHQATGIPFMFIDGNNDDSDILPTSGQDVVELADGVAYMPRGSTHHMAGRTLLAIGGAPTFRRGTKTLGEDLFANEELDDSGVQRAISTGHRIDVVISHDAPMLVQLPIASNGEFGHDNRDRVQQVVTAVSPNLVVHGHYHRNYETTIADTNIEVVGLGREKNGVPSARVLDLTTLSHTAPAL